MELENNDIIENEYIVIFNTDKELTEYIRDYGIKSGFNMSKKTSKKGKGKAKNEIVSIEYICSRGGEYNNKGKGNGSQGPKKMRKSATQKTNCPFYWKAKKREGKWFIYQVNNNHNHIMAEKDAIIKETSNQNQYNTIKQLYESGIPPNQTMVLLNKSFPNNNIPIRSVYNARQKAHLEKLGGRPPISALFDRFYNSNDFICSYKVGSNAKLTHFMFGHKKSIDLYQRHPSVLVVDATYKTNRYSMPLVEIIGIDCSNRSFAVCFIFIESEAIDDYTWALKEMKNNIFKNVSPSIIVVDRELALINSINNNMPGIKIMLCIWHIKKNVKANASKINKDVEEIKSFMIEFDKLIYSETLEEYNMNLIKFKQYADSFSESIFCYINNTWIIPYKEYFVKYCTNVFMHFGSTVSSRAESSHARVKRYIRVSTGDLDTVCNNIINSIEIQVKQLTISVEAQKIKTRHCHNIPMFQLVIGNISDFALNKAKDQYNRMIYDKDVSPSMLCFCPFSLTMGIPCEHRLKFLQEKSENLKITDFSHQWYLYNNKSLPCISFDGQNNDLDSILQEIANKHHQKSPYEQAITINKLRNLDNDTTKIYPPEIKQTKGRPKGSLNKRNPKNIIHREPSEFEYY